jgi:heme-degrading monooxygenase HmoA
MFAVLFEVEPKPERWDDYLRHAALLRPELLTIDGFLDNRRFRSRQRPGTLLSLSYWRDEKALIRWRTHALHHEVQTTGRNHVFRDYHLRVGEVVRDGGAPLPRTRLEETDNAVAHAATVIEAPEIEALPDVPGLAAAEFYDGVTDPASRLLLLTWRDPVSMDAWNASVGQRRTDIIVVRDYGLRDRGEAPQYFPPVLSPDLNPGPRMLGSPNERQSQS